MCISEGRILLTLDTDFADIRTYPPSAYAGIIVLRLNQQSKTQVLRAVSRILSVIDHEELNGCLWIVEEEYLRIRE